MAKRGAARIDPRQRAQHDRDITGDALPVGLSFLGAAWNEGRLLGLAYSFEQATHARRLPVHTPMLPDDRITLP